MEIYNFIYMQPSIPDGLLFTWDECLNNSFWLGNKLHSQHEVLYKLLKIA